MSTILYNMLQYCSVLYNMKYLIVMHWFSDALPLDGKGEALPRLGTPPIPNADYPLHTILVMN